jgi:hypothetical protein
MIYCEHGNLLDSQGCPVCGCKHAPAVVKCDEVMCMIYCENGYLKDERGCNVCGCNE